MKIESLTMENIRSYGETTVNFEEGLLLVYGDNGAGKSSLLGSIFGGLYLSNILDYIDDDLTLDSLVRRTAENGKIQLTFSIGNDCYTVEWEIRVREDDDGGRQASTKSCTLTGDALDEPVEGVKAVDETIQELVGLGPESFINSVYVQQGDISRMVHAGDDKRKEIIDGLLGLSKLDAYIERMDEARRELGAQKRRIDDLLAEKERQLDEYNDKNTLQDELKELEKQKKKFQDSKGNAEEHINEYSGMKTDAEQALEEHEDLIEEQEEAELAVAYAEKKHEDRKQKQKEAEQEKKAIEVERDAFLSAIEDSCSQAGIEAEKKTVVSELETARTARDAQKTTVTKLREGELENVRTTINQHQDTIRELEDSVDSATDTVDLLNESIEEIETELENTTQQIEKTDTLYELKKTKLKELCEDLDLPPEATLSELRGTHIPRAREELLERAQSVYESLGATELEYEQYEQLESTGVCPICEDEHDSVDDTFQHHLDELDDDVEKVRRQADAMEDQQNLLDELDEHIDSLRSVSSKRERLTETKQQITKRLQDKQSQLDQARDSLETSKESLAEEQKALESTQEDKEQLEEQLDEEQEKLDELEGRVETLENIEKKFDSLDDLTQEIESRASDIEHHKELKKEALNQRLDAEKKRDELEKQLEGIDVEELEERVEKAEEKLRTAEKVKSVAESSLSEVRDDIAETKQELRHVEETEARCRELESQKLQAAEKEREAEEVIDSYHTVKTRLRKENIGLLNKYANEVFQSVYHSKIYQRLEIDDDYSITLITGDNVEIKPSELSGGEETIVSLAIRAGVYRLLVERQGNADTLPPFILDEPTTFLDTTHVSNLQNVIDKITDWDVPQVIVVSHKDNMIQNADVAYRVTKSPATETSAVNRE